MALENKLAHHAGRILVIDIKDEDGREIPFSPARIGQEYIYEVARDEADDEGRFTADGGTYKVLGVIYYLEYERAPRSKFGDFSQIKEEDPSPIYVPFARYVEMGRPDRVEKGPIVVGPLK